MINATSYARHAAPSEGRIYADALDPISWRRLQETYKIGSLTMPCCDAPAIPKTSPLGLQFFAHASGTCGAAPESVWHQAAKEAVAAAAKALGYQATIERAGKGWKADVLIEHPLGPAVVECQHSYQHLRAYVSRQQRYRDSRIRCLWLLMDQRWGALGKSMWRHRSKHDFAGKAVPIDQAAALPAFPAATLDLNAAPWVAAPNLYAPLADVLQAFLDDRLLWDRGYWLIDGVPIKYRPPPPPIEHA